MSFLKRYGLALAALLVAFAALAGYFIWGRKPAPRQVAVTRAAYFWTSSEPGRGGRKLIDSLGMKKLYLKMFDVEWQGGLGPQPIDQQYLFLKDLKAREYYGEHPDWAGKDYTYPADPLRSLALVPTVFITNRCLLNLPKDRIDTLARKIADRLRFLIPAGSPVYNQVAEYQIDCDWTDRTRDTYFALLRSLKSRLSGPVSVTIRLYQFKYREKTGIPPVDRGMLMAYNVNPLAKAAKEKTILDIPTVKDYLRGAQPYPLPLDVALPVFNWGLLLRKDRVVGILSKGSAERAEGMHFLEKQGDDRYVSRADTVYESFFLRHGDEIRFEKPSAEELQEAAELCAPISATGTVTVSLFNLSGTLLTDYSHADLVDTYDAFR